MESFSDNPIEEMCCPKCGNTEKFNIVVTTTVSIVSEGYLKKPSSYEWDNDSVCTCPKCGFVSLVSGFYPIFIDDDENYDGYSEEDYD